MVRVRALNKGRLGIQGAVRQRVNGRQYVAELKDGLHTRCQYTAKPWLKNRVEHTPGIYRTLTGGRGPRLL